MYRFPVWHSLLHLTILRPQLLKGHATCVAPLTVYVVPKYCSSNEDNKKSLMNWGWLLLNESVRMVRRFLTNVKKTWN